MSEWIGCIECVYNLFGKCPAGHSYNNATCLMLRRSITEIDKEELRERIEKEYENDLKIAEKTYRMRLTIAGISEREDVSE